MKKNIAIFASGSGSNAERLTNYFAESEHINVSLFLTNNKSAGVIERGQRLGVPTIIFSKASFINSERIISLLVNQKIDHVVLAGFLWLVPQNLLNAFPDKIINIHPALLPKYSGKGMWGHHVHEAVVKNNETESGITIHLVNEEYDKGEVLFQAKCEVLPTDSASNVATKIQRLEHEHLPVIVEQYIIGSES